MAEQRETTWQRSVVNALWAVVGDLLTVALVVAMFVFPAVLIVNPQATAAWPAVLTVALALFAVLGVFPLTFYAYQSHRKESKIARLSNDFKLLGLVDQRDGDVEETVRNLYERVYNWRQYTLYIAPILVFSVVVLAVYAPFSPFGAQTTLGLPLGPATAVPLQLEPSTTAAVALPPDGTSTATTTVITSSTGLTLTTLLTTTAAMSADLPMTVTAVLTTALPTAVGGAPASAFIPQNPDVIRLLFFAYLGAYVYGVMELIRRYNTFDLQPQVYAGILARMVTAVALVFVGALAVFNAGSGYQAPAAAPGFATLWLPGVVAFVIGAFPSRGLDWLWRLAEPVLTGRAADLPTTLPIDHLLGVSTWHAARLQQIGIDDAQNLAGADLKELLLSTPFDAQVLVNWVDQALLYTRVGAAIGVFRKQQITTFGELQQVVGAGNDAEDRELALRLGLADAAQLQRLATAENFPNYHHLKEYYARTALVAHRFAQDAQDAIIGKVGYRNFDDAIRFGERSLQRAEQRATADHELLFTVGTAYYQRALEHKSRERSQEAEVDVKRALALFDRAEQAAPDAPDPFYGRALCRLVEGLPTTDAAAAIDDCTRAIARSRYFAEAFVERANAHARLQQWDLALRDLDEALRLNDRLAAAYAARGRVRLQLAQSNLLPAGWDAPAVYREAQSDFEKAHLCGYPDRGGQQLGLGQALLGQGAWAPAMQALTAALGLLDEGRQAEALWLRQQAFCQLQRFDAALDDLRRLLHSANGRSAEQTRPWRRRYGELLALRRQQNGRMVEAI